MGIFDKMPKGMNKGAYRGRLTCPVCDSEANRLIERITPFRLRYRCRKCGLTYQYDITGAPPGFDGGAHPYAPFKKPRFKRIIEAWNFGRKIKGGN